MRMCTIPGSLILAGNLQADIPIIQAQAAALLCSGWREGAALADLTSLRADGSWADIDYRDQNRGYWSPRIHLIRMNNIAFAWNQPDSALYRQERALQGVLNALDFWVAGGFTSPNWWHSEIGTPRELCGLMLVLGDQVPPDRCDQVRELLDISRPGMTAQNRIWLAGIHLWKGVIFQEPARVAEGAAMLHEEFTLAGPGQEGLQPDWSFHQHGPQLQFGNYGLGFFQDMVTWTVILRNTRCAMPLDKVEILENYYKNGLRWVCFAGTMDPNACGRQIGPGQPRSKYRSVLSHINLLHEMIPDGEQVFDHALRFRGCRSFPDSDFFVYRTPDSYWSVRMTSARTKPSETVNSENLLGKHAGHGGTMFLTGDLAAVDLGAVCDWRRLPGVTAVCGEGPLECKDPGWRNRLDWTGGLTDGEMGLCAMDFDNGEVQARKSWFFSGGTMTAVGSGIAAQVDAPVLTSITQLRSRQDHDLQRVVASGETVADGAFTYRVLRADGEMIAQNRLTEGSWRRIIAPMPDDPVRERLFSLWINHGSRPAGAGYAYQVSDAAAANPAVGLLETSSPDIHALLSGDAIMAACFTAGTVTLPGGNVIRVDQPCLLMLRNRRLYAADPGRSLPAVTVSCSGVECRIALPEGRYAGTTAVMDLPNGI